MWKWRDPQYLRAAYGARTVPVELGVHYLATGWGQRLMTLAEFIDHHVVRAAVPGSFGTGQTVDGPTCQTGGRSGSGACSGAGGRSNSSSNDSHQSCVSSEGERRGYLAQHELFDQIPVLRRDIWEPDFCRLGDAGCAAVNAWFGPPGTVSRCTPCLARVQCDTQLCICLL